MDAAVAQVAQALNMESPHVVQTPAVDAGGGHMDAAAFAAKLEAIAATAATVVPEGDKEIFKFKYQARAELVALQAQLLLCPAPSPEAIAQLAQVNLHIGTNYIETEEPGAGQDYLQTALRDLQKVRRHVPLKEDGTPSDPIAEGTIVDQRWDAILVDVYNHLGVLWSGRSENPKALKFLKAAEDLYILNQEQADKLAKLEEKHLQTVFFLAQIYTHLGDKVAAARYCMTTLQKQLLLKRDFDKVDWMTNCMHLSGYFLDQEDFSLADYCMRAADHVVSDGGKDERIEANLCIAHGKYYSHVLRVSHKRLEAGDDRPLVAGQQPGLFNLPIEAPIAALPLVRTFDEAREVFKKALPQFEKSLSYYTFDTECTTHIDVQSDMCVLWRQLIQYEPDAERRISMHKRRAALYEHIAGHIQVQCYMSYVRKVHFELGEIWNEVGEIRQTQLQHGLKVSVKKINEACHNAVRNFELFLATFMESEQTNQTTELPEVDTSKEPPVPSIEDEYHRTYIIANMHIARQYCREQCDTYTEAAQRLMAAKDRYNYTLECADRFRIPLDGELKEELKMCREMAVLLPTKLKELHKQYPT